MAILISAHFPAKSLERKYPSSSLTRFCKYWVIFKEKLILGKLDQIVIKYEMQFENTFLNHVKNFSIHSLSSLSQNISKDICLVLPLDIKEGVIFDIYWIKKKSIKSFTVIRSLVKNYEAMPPFQKRNHSAKFNLLSSSFYQSSTEPGCCQYVFVSVCVCFLSPWFGLWLVKSRTLSRVHFLWEQIKSQQFSPHGQLEA